MPGNQDVFSAAINAADHHRWDSQWGEALKEYQKALSEFPEDATARSGLGFCYMQMKQWQQALKEYETVLRRDPGNVIALSKMAELYGILNRREEAYKGYVYLADLYAHAGQGARAEAAWQKAVQLSPGNPEPHERLASYYFEKKDIASMIQQRLAAAQGYLSQKEPGLARIQCEEVLRADENNIQAQQLLAQIAGKLSGGANPTANPESGSQQPQGTAPADSTTSGPLSSNSTGNSLADTVTTGNMSGGNTSIMGNMGSAGNFGGVSSPGSSMSMPGTGGGMTQAPRKRITASQVTGVLRQAQTYQNQGRFNDAIDLCEQILESGFDRPDARYFLGWLYQEQQRWDDAIRQFQMLLNDPDYALSCYYALGQCYRARGDLRTATVHFDEAVDRVNLDALTVEESDQLVQLCQEAAEAHRLLGETEQAFTVYSALLGFLRSRGWSEKVAQVEFMVQQAQNAPSMPGRQATPPPGNPFAMSQDGMQSMDNPMQGNSIPDAATMAFNANQMANMSGPQSIPPAAPATTPGQPGGELPDWLTGILNDSEKTQLVNNKKPASAPLPSPQPQNNPPSLPEMPTTMQQQVQPGNPAPPQQPVEEARTTVIDLAQMTNLAAQQAAPPAPAPQAPQVAPPQPAPQAPAASSSWLTEDAANATQIRPPEQMPPMPAPAAQAPAQPAAQLPVQPVAQAPVAPPVSAPLPPAQQPVSAPLPPAQQPVSAPLPPPVTSGALPPVFEPIPPATASVSPLDLGSIIAGTQAAPVRDQRPSTEQLLNQIAGRKDQDIPQVADAILESTAVLPDNIRAQVVRSMQDIQQYINHGLLNSATDECLRVIDMAPQYLDVHQVLCEIYIRQGKIEQAITKYAILVDTYIVNGRTEDAIATYRRILQLEPNNLTYRMRLINLLSSQGNKEDLLRERTQAAESYLRLGYMDRALTELEQALQESPTSVPTRLNYALALQKLGRTQQAVTEYQRVLQVQPGNITALIRWHIAMITSIGAPRSTSLEVLTRIRWQLRGEGQRQADAVIREYTQAVEIYPNNADVHYALGQIYQQAGMFDRAIDSYTLAMRDSAVDVLARMSATQCLLIQGKPEAAIQHLEQALQSVKRSPTSLDPATWAARPREEGEIHQAPEMEISLLLAKAYGRTGRQDQMDAIMRQIKQVKPDQSEVSSVLAEISARQHDPNSTVQEYLDLVKHYREKHQGDSALSVLNEMVRMLPQEPRAHAELADIYIGRGLLDEGIAELRLLADIYLRKNQLEEASEALQQIGNLYDNMGNNEEALSNLCRAAELNPTGMDLLREVVGFCWRIGRIPEAIRYQVTIARHYFETHQVKEAVAALQQLIALDRNNLDAYDMLGQTYQSVGEYEQASRVYRNLAKVNPGSSVARDRLATLQELRSR
ncbi:tetratricopeptide repeat protein [Reticulibacter mediterranei]|nr:tetratricopeptide repeat protein [Reticulibacter mediterranei]